MIEQVIPWNTGEGNVVVSYEGKGKGELSITSPDNPLWEDRSMTIIVETTAGSPEKAETIVLLQKGKTLTVGTKFNFDYTGTVQSVELPKGKYKLQCWGAQGGTSYGSSSAVGSKGGYSEGILTLDNTTTLYVFVGGKGSMGTSTSLVNGGWNGGGAAVGYSYYNSGDEYGESYPACGGGATDIALETSSMSYSSGRTNRSSASLLSRIIVAGGGAGGSYAYQEVTKEITSSYYEDLGGDTGSWSEYEDAEDGNTLKPRGEYRIPGSQGDTLRITIEGDFEKAMLWYSGYTTRDWLSGDDEITLRKQPAVIVIWGGSGDAYVSFQLLVEDTTTETNTDSLVSNKAQQGGGTSGKGQYPGKQNAAGQNGGFGYGANMTTTNYRYCSGGGGGGWYGGGAMYSDGLLDYVNYSGGGSGFVNTKANASYRPSGYTGLQLDSGTTIAGSSTFESPSGGTETGHAGNGNARITVIDDNYEPEPEPTYNIEFAVQAGSWSASSNSAAATGESWTCSSPGHSGSTIIRCTFSGVTSITFNCKYQGESNYDYLTIGKIDTTCSRTSYGTSLKGTSGTAKNITFTCDSGTHYVEFCYSKDNSVSESPDNATVYVSDFEIA